MGSAARRYLFTEETEDFLNSAAAEPILAELDRNVDQYGAPINPDGPGVDHDGLGEADRLLEPPTLSEPLITDEMHKAQLDRLHMTDQGINGLQEALLEPNNVVQMPGTERQEIHTGDITNEIEGGKLVEIGNRVKHTYDIDEASRGAWLEGYTKALELVDYQEKAKDYPIEGAANIKYPLLVMASLQFAARAGPAIIKPGNMVRMKVEGLEPEAPNPEEMDPSMLQTPEGQQQFMLAMLKASKTERAGRVSRYMSWQLRRTKTWEEETDALLHKLPLTGCEFRKVYQDAGTGKKKSILVSSKNVTINMKARSVEEAPRITECFELYPYQMQSKILSGHFRDIRDEINYDPEALDNQEPIEQPEYPRRCNTGMCSDHRDRELHRERQEPPVALAPGEHGFLHARAREPGRHHESLLEGVFDSADIAYYLLLIIGFLGLTVRQLDRERLL